jgi:predicted patatin/cPLA2 family phospholipase
MKLLSISGGATKISGLAGASDTLINELNYKPDLIVGTSAGAILALPLAMNYWESIRRETTEFTIDDIFSKAPMNEKGKITLSGKFRLLFGKLSLGVQDNLVNTISRIITEDDYQLYLSSDIFPNVYIGTVDYKSGKRHYTNMKECSYDEYLQYVLASTSIPYAAEPVYMDGKILFDGGARDHIGSHWMMENIKSITENVSIYSRPQDFKSILDKNWNPDNILDVFERDQAIRVLETSKKDEKLERLIASDLNIKHTAIFLPSIMKSLYDTNPARIAKLYHEGEKAAVKYYSV